MSSIVSRSPPPSVSTSQAKDFFWMSIRFGTSTDLSRRANVRRVREPSTEAKTATPQEVGVERARCAERTQDKQARPGKIARQKRRPEPGALCNDRPITAVCLG